MISCFSGVWSPFLPEAPMSYQPGRSQMILRLGIEWQLACIQIEDEIAMR
jgi:hypothetical protein